MQMVEIAQFEEAQVRDDQKHKLDHLTNRHKLLLDERQQEINLAKSFCTEYNPFNEHWVKVKYLSLEMSELKK